MEKLNIAEILKDCPKGMELDCPMFDGLEFDRVDEYSNTDYPIICRVKRKSGNCRFFTFTKCGCYNSEIFSKCVIFPKGKTTWEGFKRPFKDGDVVFYDDNIAIFKEWGDETLFRTYVKLYIHRESIDIGFPLFGKYVRKETRLATEEEKQKLFDAIKANGYKWNAETKTLEKLITLNFKIGDKIRAKGTNFYTKILGIKWDQTETYYETSLSEISVKDQDEFELIPNKFDITTLKPFDKVLVRDSDEDFWSITMYSHYVADKCYPFVTIFVSYPQCIPYEGNQHLLGTTNDCDEYYKTWK